MIVFYVIGPQISVPSPLLELCSLLTPREILQKTQHNSIGIYGSRLGTL